MPDDVVETADTVSADEMRTWLSHERVLLELLTERRVSEATALVEAYATGNASWEETDRKWREYLHRWARRLCDDDQLLADVEREAAAGKIVR